MGEKVKAITESAMQGDFEDSFKQHKASKGLDASVLKEVAENLPITEDCRLMKVLQSWFKTAIFR